MAAVGPGTLPPLREELSVHSGPSDRTGAPTWTIRDPIRNQFFRISWSTFEILSRWHLGSASAVADAVAAETTLHPMPEDVAEIAEFLAAHQLTRPMGREDTVRLVGQAAAGGEAWHKAVLHNYLFFRIPLLRPDRWLTATESYVRWLGSRWFLGATLVALLLGLVLVARQWDLFAGTLVDTFSPTGLVSYALALSLVKAVHELAHAYTAKRFGCRVPTMGVAFLVLWPVLYTDVNETWLLSRRGQRLAVGGAGILAELVIAAWASLAWAFLPDGALKQAAFTLAALTWVTSLTINVSPFMRFDGYFLVMDALEMPNLHPRSFAMARWWLREVLFGLGDRQPEPMAAMHRRALIAFAIVVWVYRLVLFLGIAVLVYHFFIKAVGVLLFAVEIGWFVLLPIWKEIMEWRKRKTAITGTRRTRLTASVAAALILLAAIPWHSRVQAPAVLKASETAALYLPFAARLETIHVRRGEMVRAGQPLFTFTSPDIDLRRAAVLARLEGRSTELEAAQLDPFLQSRLGILREDVARARAELAALDGEQARLILTAPFDGTVLDLLPDLGTGDWLSPQQKLGLVRSDAGAAAAAYVAEDDLHRLHPGAEAIFVPSDPDFPSRDGQLTHLTPLPVRDLADGILASVHGGPLATRLNGDAIVPEAAFTRATIALNGPAPEFETPGTVMLTGERRSLLGRLTRSVLVVLVREWGA